MFADIPLSSDARHGEGLVLGFATAYLMLFWLVTDDAA
jgi:hypothetical protein